MQVLENRFYYLDNFHTVLRWVQTRYEDLLNFEEHQFITQFFALPQSSQALMVRMVMRKGTLFRASKLNYAEIASTSAAAQALVKLGWIEHDPSLTLEQLFGLLTKVEIGKSFALSAQQNSLKKLDLMAELGQQFADLKKYSSWTTNPSDCVYKVLVDDFCERLRLMFFGNLRQNWSEFVLAELGIFRYETVQFSANSRAFHSRQEIDAYLHLHRCSERFWQGESVDVVLIEIAPTAFENSWLENRRAKLLFQIGNFCEQQGDLHSALQIYSVCSYPASRSRMVRVLERDAQFQAAFDLANIALKMPESEAEQQLLLRIVPRLRRKLCLPKTTLTLSDVGQVSKVLIRHDIELFKPESCASVEWLTRDYFLATEPEALVFYVENTLINALFGLLCWDAIFAPIPGAFFHPFHHGPSDLFHADFYLRRHHEFAECLSRLDDSDSENYKRFLRNIFSKKFGIESPFVVWQTLSQELLELALQCIPASHLKKLFLRVLSNVKQNRAGFPDLIRFWPATGRYQMIEVKGPGDRLQDNQTRWLDFFAQHDLPAAVCYVRWKAA